MIKDNRMMKNIKKRIILPTLFLFFVSAVFSPAAKAAMVTTDMFMGAKTYADRVSYAHAWLDRQVVQDQLSAFGVDPNEAKARIAALSDAEILQLQNKLQDLPAGGGAIEVIGVLFLVLLILELVGITDIFKKI